MVMTQIEIGCDVLEVGVHVDGQTVLPSHAHSEVDISIHREVSALLSYEPYFAIDVVMDEFPLRTRYFSAHRDVVLYILVAPYGVRQRYPVVHPVPPEFVCAKECDTHLCPLVESLTQSHSQGVAHGQGIGLVIHVGPMAIVMIRIIVVWRAVGYIIVIELPDVQGVYETGDGHELLWHHMLAHPIFSE